MLEIAKSNSETSNNSVRLAAATLAVNVTKLATTAFALGITAAPLRLVYASAYKGSRVGAASSAT
jgi:hypothetical protein